MSELTDEQHAERYLRAGGIANREDVRALLRLLDAERARADAAEAEVRPGRPACNSKFEFDTTDYSDQYED